MLWYFAKRHERTGVFKFHHCCNLITSKNDLMFTKVYTVKIPTLAHTRWSCVSYCNPHTVAVSLDQNTEYSCWYFQQMYASIPFEIQYVNTLPYRCLKLSLLNTRYLCYLAMSYNFVQSYFNTTEKCYESFGSRKIQYARFEMNTLVINWTRIEQIQSILTTTIFAIFNVSIYL